MKKLLVSIFCTSIIFGLPALAEEKLLSVEEAKVLFSGKTFDGFNEAKGKSYRVYSAADGKMLHKNKKRTKELTWEIDSEGQHCAYFNNPNCGKILSVGDGVYHKIRDGEHTNTLKNFVEGNQL